jgi:hypothetical protein
MNQISSALAQAGVKLPPLMQRVWQVLRDSKLPRSAKTVSQLLNVKTQDVSSVLSSLMARKMVERQFQVLSLKTGFGTAKREVAHYVALGSTYELRPLPPAKKAPAPKPDVEQRFLRAPEAPVSPPPLQKPAPVDIENMTLSDARALYKRLQEFFG